MYQQHQKQSEQLPLHNQSSNWPYPIDERQLQFMGEINFNPSPTTARYSSVQQETNINRPYPIEDRQLEYMGKIHLIPSSTAQYNTVSSSTNLGQEEQMYEFEISSSDNSSKNNNSPPKGATPAQENLMGEIPGNTLGASSKIKWKYVTFSSSQPAPTPMPVEQNSAASCLSSSYSQIANSLGTDNSSPINQADIVLSEQKVVAAASTFKDVDISSLHNWLVSLSKCQEDAATSSFVFGAK